MLTQLTQIAYHRRTPINATMSSASSETTLPNAAPLRRSPTKGNSLRPVAIGAVVEVRRRLKPLV